MPLKGSPEEEAARLSPKRNSEFFPVLKFFPEHRGKHAYSLEHTSIQAIGDEPVSLFGFGTFNCKHRDERTGRNPATGEAITIAASNTPVFKPAKAFKEKVN